MSPSAVTGASSTFNSFITAVEAQILTPIMTLLALAAFVLFVWGVVEYIRGADSDERRKTGQQHIIWGIVGLVIIFGADTIIAVISNTATSVF